MWVRALAGEIDVLYTSPEALAYLPPWETYLHPKCRLQQKFMKSAMDGTVGAHRVGLNDGGAKGGERKFLQQKPKSVSDKARFGSRSLLRQSQVQ
eukprot:229636-Amphidinium_carterae.1